MDKIVKEEELRANDGQENRPVFVAYKGKVYDLSASKMWRGGLHVRRHHAGNDLTADLPAAPHDESVFQRATVTLVGDLAPAAVEQPAATAELPAWLEFFLARHPHPVSVHFPIAYSAALAVLLIIYLLGGDRTFEIAAYYFIWAGVVTGVIAMAMGVTSWWFNHGRTMKTTYVSKMVMSLVFLVVGIVALTLRTANPDALVTRDPTGWVYFVLTLVLVVLVAALGWVGDIIMWGK